LERCAVAGGGGPRGGFDVMIEANAAASLVLTKAGVVENYCRFNPKMTGQITITPE
jgi:hypothetical protein